MPSGCRGLGCSSAGDVDHWIAVVVEMSIYMAPLHFAQQGVLESSDAS